MLFSCVVFVGCGTGGLRAIFEESGQSNLGYAAREVSRETLKKTSLLKIAMLRQIVLVDLIFVVGGSAT